MDLNDLRGVMERFGERKGKEDNVIMLSQKQNNI